jgi:hypothetical protein
MNTPSLTIVGIAPWAWLLVVAVGCSDPTAIRPGDIRTYAAPAAPTSATKPSSQPRAPGPLALSYDVPAGWTDRGSSGMRLATLIIDGPDGGHEVTVIPAAGTLEANVSRWLGQLDPSATPEALLERTARVLAEAKKQQVGDGEATLLTLMEESAKDSDEVILGAMIPLDESASLFVKFKGPAEVARRERESFSRFVSSLRWNEEARR